MKKKQNRVVHPLFDGPEEKKDPNKAPPMKMTGTVKFVLITLRIYLSLMLFLVVYRVGEIAGFWHVFN